MLNRKEQDIYVNRPFLPPLEEFTPYLEEIWSSRILTNNGPFHEQLEDALCDYLGVEYVSLFANGTLALLTALQVLHITGEVITTPFSFVATTHALRWNSIDPVFVDVEPETFTLDPVAIEKAITPKTTAILPVHVYGYPCKVVEISKIADIYGLKVIYDAAHTFGARLNGTSMCSFGDLSVLSFHATKVFTTFEGGAIICHDKATKQRIDYLKNFGFAGETSVMATGINAKMNEVESAMGLLQLKYIEKSIERRKEVAMQYRERLKGIEGLHYIDDFAGVKHNYSYFPIFIDPDKFRVSRDELCEGLKQNKIFCRQYFYPLISQFFPYRELVSSKPEGLPVATRVAEQVLCLPIYPEMRNEDVEKICGVIRGKL